VRGDDVKRSHSIRLLSATILFGAIGNAHADDAVRLTTDDSTAETDPAWSPDGSRIAYSVLGIEQRDIWVISSSGGSATPITTTSSVDADPSWSPDGRQIVYRSDRNLPPGHGTNLWIVSIAGGPPKQLTFSSDHDWNPSWSPLGDAVCFARGLHTYERTVWRVAVIDGQESQVVDGVAHTPAWSPDGSRIACVARPGGFWHLFVLPASGGPMTQVTPDLPWSSYVDDPSWSPDGLHIAYVSTSQSSPVPQIWVIPTTGGLPMQLTDGDGTDKTPAWSPDGRTIAFSSERSGSADIWLIDLPTTGVEETTWSAMKRKYAVSSPPHSANTKSTGPSK
jgi:TolB protein